MEKGYIYIFTGNGKGKTSAALGLALRAAGAGLNSLFIHFMKQGFPYSELQSLPLLNQHITVAQFCDDEFVLEKRPATQTEMDTAKEGLIHCQTAIQSGKYDLIILDEIGAAVHFGLIDADEVATLFPLVRNRCDLVLTGRYCPEQWFVQADVVSEMKEIKHYYQKGVLSRKGIDC